MRYDTHTHTHTHTHIYIYIYIYVIRRLKVKRHHSNLILGFFFIEAVSLCDSIINLLAPEFGI